MSPDGIVLFHFSIQSGKHPSNMWKSWWKSSTDLFLRYIKNMIIVCIFFNLIDHKRTYTYANSATTFHTMFEQNWSAWFYGVVYNLRSIFQHTNPETILSSFGSLLVGYNMLEKCFLSQNFSWRGREKLLGRVTPFSSDLKTGSICVLNWLHMIVLPIFF